MIDFHLSGRSTGKFASPAETGNLYVELTRLCRSVSRSLQTLPATHRLTSVRMRPLRIRIHALSHRCSKPPVLAPIRSPRSRRELHTLVVRRSPANTLLKPTTIHISNRFFLATLQNQGVASGSSNCSSKLYSPVNPLRFADHFQPGLEKCIFRGAARFGDNHGLYPVISACPSIAVQPDLIYNECLGIEIYPSGIRSMGPAALTPKLAGPGRHRFHYCKRNLVPINVMTVS